jgi:hypothetical protein
VVLGAKLYARSSAVFRPFILNHFSEWTTANNRWDRVHWADHTADLEAWLQAARTIALDEFDDWFQLDEATAISLPKSEHAHGFVRARSIAGAACRQGGGAALRHQELPTIVMLALSLAAHDPSET